MNRDIHDMRFDGSEEDLLLQDFISRAELTNVVGAWRLPWRCLCWHAACGWP